MPRTGLSATEIKQRAIEATMAKMREEGFDKVRLIEIARELGVSHAALYAHFKDKTALLDAVSERWLTEIDESLEAVCRKAKDPAERIVLWMITLHRAKLAKVMHDPELYKAYNHSVTITKPFAAKHLATIRAQLTGLVKEAIAKRGLKHADANEIAEILQTSTMAFHHPRLVAQHVGEKREPLLRSVLDTVMRGLNLKA